MRGISWVAEDLLVSQKGLCSKDLVTLVKSIFDSDRIIYDHPVLE